LNISSTLEPGDGNEWFVSSFSNASGGCVEVRFVEHGVVLVRDSKDRRASQPIVGVPSYGWVSLLKTITG
jgi:Domain of unknown function (DUF397)